MRQVSEVRGHADPLGGSAAEGDREAASFAVRPRIVKTSDRRQPSRGVGRRFRAIVGRAAVAAAALAALPAFAADPPDGRPRGAAGPPQIELDRSPDGPRDAERHGPIRRLAVIGASASDGFNCRAAVRTDAGVRMVEVDLARVLPAVVELPGLAVSDLADSTFFLRPREVGRRQVEAAIACAPDLLLAPDFLFWFAYGTLDGAGPVSDDEVAARLDRLESGLALLDRTACPIVVGDLPDMSAAVGTMLSRRQMPSAEALLRMNERIVAWAAERPRVRVLALGRLVAHLRDAEPIRIGSLEWSARELVGTMQPDRLHPTPEGLLVLAAQAAHDAAELLGDGALPLRGDAASVRRAMAGALRGE